MAIDDIKKTKKKEEEKEKEEEEVEEEDETTKKWRDDDDNDRLTREDYEQILARYDALSAEARSGFGRIDRAGDAALAAYDEACERHRAALGDIGHQIGWLEVEIDRFEEDKVRLTAGLAAERAASEAADELGQARYGRVLDYQRLDGRFAEMKYGTVTQDKDRRTGLLDEMVAVAELKRRLEQDHRDNLYDAEQVQISENAIIISGQERNLHNWFKMVNDNKNCADQMDILWNKKEENKKSYEYSVNRKKYYALKKEKEIIFYQLKITNIDENTYPFKKENFVASSMDNTYNRLIKQKEIVQLKKNQLINEVLSQKTSGKEYFKNAKGTKKLENNENHMMDIMNYYEKELIRAKDFRKQKLDYVMKMFEENAIIIEKANKFITGESEDNLEDIEWLKNRGIVRHFDGKPEYIS